MIKRLCSERKVTQEHSTIVVEVTPPSQLCLVDLSFLGASKGTMPRLVSVSFAETQKEPFELLLESVQLKQVAETVRFPLTPTARFLRLDFLGFIEASATQPPATKTPQLHVVDLSMQLVGKHVAVGSTSGEGERTSSAAAVRMKTNMAPSSSKGRSTTSSVSTNKLKQEKWDAIRLQRLRNAELEQQLSSLCHETQAEQKTQNRMLNALHRSLEEEHKQLQSKLRLWENEKLQLLALLRQRATTPSAAAREAPGAITDGTGKSRQRTPVSSSEGIDCVVPLVSHGVTTFHTGPHCQIMMTPVRGTSPPSDSSTSSTISSSSSTDGRNELREYRYTPRRGESLTVSPVSSPER